VATGEERGKTDGRDILFFFYQFCTSICHESASAAARRVASASSPTKTVHRSPRLIGPESYSGPAWQLTWSRSYPLDANTSLSWTRSLLLGQVELLGLQTRSCGLTNKRTTLSIPPLPCPQTVCRAPKPFQPTGVESGRVFLALEYTLLVERLNWNLKNSGLASG
jgi:hypothetical protein